VLSLLLCAHHIWQEGVGQDHPVVLVGHSLGGLVLKKLAVDANRVAHQEGQVDPAFQARCKAFCNNLTGVFFYATLRY